MAEASTKKKAHALKGKGGLVMAAVLVVLGGIFFLEQKAPPPRDPDSNPPVSEYAHLRSNDVTRVELKRPEGGFTLAKQGGAWSFEAPQKYRANSESVNSWLKGLLEDATVSQVVEGKPADMAPYGLDKPTHELVLTGGGKTRILQVGKDFRPTGGEMPGSIYYAREVNDGRLFMLDSAQVNDLKNKKVDDLRDKRLAVIGEEKDVQKVVLQRAAGTVEVQRRGDEWELLQPFKAPADELDVNSLISQVRSAEAQSFAEDAASDLSKYGLDQPRLTVQVTDRKGTHSVLFGKADKDGNVYAARQGENEVTLVSKFTFESLDKKSADLRERKLITQAGDKIRFVELQNAHGTVRLQKAGDGWQIENAPDPKQNKAKADTVQQVINSVSASAHKHVEETPADLAKYGLDKPQITVRVNEGAGTSQVFMLGAKTKDGNYYAKGPGSAVFEVQPFVYADLNVKPDAFKDTSAK